MSFGRELSAAIKRLYKYVLKLAISLSYTVID